MPNAKKNDTVVTVCDVLNRMAFYAKKGKPGTSIVSFKSGDQLKAATDELGGNIFVKAEDSAGERVLAALAEGEWRLA
ncbi:MAG: hypothetical protein NT154_40385 [Verrucomicrobia bacterium]|nr:hypothetical protein [Verrucomicrobiota bacterium]